MSACPECGNVEACTRCAVGADFYFHLADPHLAVGFLDGDLPCAVSGLFITEHALENGRSVCAREDSA